MTTFEDIYKGAERFINKILREEIIAQGHHLTGDLENSLESDIFKTKKADVMEGFALHYAAYVNDGFPASSASFKQVPFLIEYFTKRGFPIGSSNSETATAVQMAFATVRKWMKEGMPTQASRAFSKTGSRTDMIESAFVAHQNEIDDYMGNSLDFIVEESFQKEKSETV